MNRYLYEMIRTRAHYTYRQSEGPAMAEDFAHAGLSPIERMTRPFETLCIGNPCNPR